MNDRKLIASAPASMVRSSMNRRLDGWCRRYAIAVGMTNGASAPIEDVYAFIRIRLEETP